MPDSMRPDAPKRSLAHGANREGYFGEFGGSYVAETLMPLLQQVARTYAEVQKDAGWQKRFKGFLRDYGGRPSPLYFAERLTQQCRGAKIYFKRDELNHTGSHKINNCLGQVLLAERMGKRRIIAETGAGQHGVAAATVAARFGMKCTVFMGTKDMARQAPNLQRMQLLGAEVRAVAGGSASLKDAMNEALRDWVATVADSFYLIGTAAGPHPYPSMVRDFQSVIGEEVRAQLQAAEGRLPDTLVACIGGGSNAMGLFYPFVQERKVRLIGVEAAGKGLRSGAHAASLAAGRPGVLHGQRSYVLQDGDGQICEAHSISAGLDYPGIGPEHAWLHESGRAHYVSATDREALRAVQVCARLEGIVPALEPAHALAHVLRIAPDLPARHLLVMNMCGRGDKDMATIAAELA